MHEIGTPVVGVGLALPKKGRSKQRPYEESIVQML